MAALGTRALLPGTATAAGTSPEEGGGGGRGRGSAARAGSGTGVPPTGTPTPPPSPGSRHPPRGERPPRPGAPVPLPPRCCAEPRRFLRGGSRETGRLHRPRSVPGAGAAQRKMRAGEGEQNGVCFWQVRRKASGCRRRRPARLGSAEDRGPIVRTPSCVACASLAGSVPPPHSSGQSRVREQRSQDNNKPPFLRLRQGPTRLPYYSCCY